jgi:hypothetical protein
MSWMVIAWAPALTNNAKAMNPERTIVFFLIDPYGIRLFFMV